MPLRRLIVLLVLVFLTVTMRVRAQEEGPKPAEPVKEHQWLKQIVGEWDVEMEMTMGPDQPPVKGKGTETVRQLGELWTIAEGRGEAMGMTVNSVMTLGYDPAQKKYVGTWVDSCQTHLWKYTGTVEGNKLTLETEGPNPMNPGQTAKYREAIEIKSKDEKVLTSSMLMPDGSYVKFMTATYRRKK